MKTHQNCLEMVIKIELHTAHEYHCSLLILSIELMLLLKSLNLPYFKLEALSINIQGCTGEQFVVFLWGLNVVNINNIKCGKSA